MGLSIKEIMAQRNGGARPAAKPMVKTPAPVKEEVPLQEELTDDDDVLPHEETINDDVIPSEEEQEEVKKPVVKAAKPVVVAAPKKPSVAVAPSKKVQQSITPSKVSVPKVAKETPVVESETAAEVPRGRRRRKAAWGPVAKEKEKRDLKVGDWMPFDEFTTRFHARLQEADLAPPSKAITTALIRQFEEFFYETVRDFDVKFVQKTTRTEIQPRIYEPNKTLDRVATPYHTFVSGHTKVTLSFTFNRHATRGTVDDDSNFIEGMFNEDGSFVPGVWTADEEGNPLFTPN